MIDFGALAESVKTIGLLGVIVIYFIYALDRKDKDMQKNIEDQNRLQTSQIEAIYSLKQELKDGNSMVVDEVKNIKSQIDKLEMIMIYDKRGGSQ